MLSERHRRPQPRSHARDGPAFSSCPRDWHRKRRITAIHGHRTSSSLIAFRVTLAAMTLELCRMPLTVFDIKGVPGHRRERIETAVVAGGKHVSAPHEAWIATDPFKGGVRVLITGPRGFERTVTFAIDDDPAVIAERVRQTLED